MTQTRRAQHRQARVGVQQRDFKRIRRADGVGVGGQAAGVDSKSQRPVAGVEHEELGEVGLHGSLHRRCLRASGASRLAERDDAAIHTHIALSDPASQRGFNGCAAEVALGPRGVDGAEVFGK